MDAFAHSPVVTCYWSYRCLSVVSNPGHHYTNVKFPVEQYFAKYSCYLAWNQQSCRVQSPLDSAFRWWNSSKSSLPQFCDWHVIGKLAICANKHIFSKTRTQLSELVMLQSAFAARASHIQDWRHLLLFWELLKLFNMFSLCSQDWF